MVSRNKLLKIARRTRLAKDRKRCRVSRDDVKMKRSAEKELKKIECMIIVKKVTICAKRSEPISRNKRFLNLATREI
jgi:hypothetical protein